MLFHVCLWYKSSRQKSCPKKCYLYAILYQSRKKNILNTYVQIFLEKHKLYIVYIAFVHGYDVFKVYFQATKMQTNPYINDTPRTTQQQHKRKRLMSF